MGEGDRGGGNSSVIFCKFMKKKYKKDIPFYFTNLKARKMKLWGQAKIARCFWITKYWLADAPAREWTYM